MGKKILKLRRKSLVSYAEDSSSSDTEQERKASPPKKKLLKIKQRNSRRWSAPEKKMVLRNRNERDELWLPQSAAIDNDEKSYFNTQSDSNRETREVPRKRCYIQPPESESDSSRHTKSDSNSGASRSVSVSGTEEVRRKRGRPTKSDGGHTKSDSNSGACRSVSVSGTEEVRRKRGRPTKSDGGHTKSDSNSGACRSVSVSDTEEVRRKFGRPTKSEQEKFAKSNKSRQEPTRFSARRALVGLLKTKNGRSLRKSFEAWLPTLPTQTKKYLKGTTGNCVTLPTNSINNSKFVNPKSERNIVNGHLNKSTTYADNCSSLDSEQGGRESPPHKRHMPNMKKEAPKEKMKSDKLPYRSKSCSDSNRKSDSNSSNECGTREESRKTETGKDPVTNHAKTQSKIPWQKPTRFSTRLGQPKSTSDISLKDFLENYMREDVEITTENSDAPCPLNPKKSAKCADNLPINSAPEQDVRKSPPKMKELRVNLKRCWEADFQANKIANEKKMKSVKLPPQSESGSDSHTKSDSNFGAIIKISRGETGEKLENEPKKPKKEQAPRLEPTRFSTRKSLVGQLETTDFLHGRPCSEVSNQHKGNNIAESFECASPPNKSAKYAEDSSSSSDPEQDGRKSPGNKVIRNRKKPWSTYGRRVARKIALAQRAAEAKKSLELRHQTASRSECRTTSDNSSSSSGTEEDTRKSGRLKSHTKSDCNSGASRSDSVSGTEEVRRKRGRPKKSNKFVEPEKPRQDTRFFGRKSSISQLNKTGKSVLHDEHCLKPSQSKSCSDHTKEMDSTKGSESTASTKVPGRGTTKESRKCSQTSNGLRNGKDNMPCEYEKKSSDVPLSQPPVSQLEHTNGPCLQIQKNNKAAELCVKVPVERLRARLRIPPADQVINNSLKNGPRLEIQIQKHDKCEELCAKRSGKQPPQALSDQHPVEKLKNKGESSLPIQPGLEILQNVSIEELCTKKPEKETPSVPLDQPLVYQLKSNGTIVLRNRPCLESSERQSFSGRAKKPDSAKVSKSTSIIAIHVPSSESAIESRKCDQRPNSLKNGKVEMPCTNKNETEPKKPDSAKVNKSTSSAKVPSSETEIESRKCNQRLNSLKNRKTEMSCANKPETEPKKPDSAKVSKSTPSARVSSSETEIESRKCDQRSNSLKNGKAEMPCADKSEKDSKKPDSTKVSKSIASAKVPTSETAKESEKCDQRLSSLKNGEAEMPCANKPETEPKKPDSAKVSKSTSSAKLPSSETAIESKKSYQRSSSLKNGKAEMPCANKPETEPKKPDSAKVSKSTSSAKVPSSETAIESRKCAQRSNSLKNGKADMPCANKPETGPKKADSAKVSISTSSAKVPSSETTIESRKCAQRSKSLKNEKAEMQCANKPETKTKKPDSAKVSRSTLSAKVPSSETAIESRKCDQRSNSLKNGKVEKPCASKPEKEPTDLPLNRPPEGQLEHRSETVSKTGPCLEPFQSCSDCTKKTDSAKVSKFTASAKFLSSDITTKSRKCYQRSNSLKKVTCANKSEKEPTGLPLSQLEHRGETSSKTGPCLESFQSCSDSTKKTDSAKVSKFTASAKVPSSETAIESGKCDQRSNNSTKVSKSMTTGKVPSSETTIESRKCNQRSNSLKNGKVEKPCASKPEKEPTDLPLSQPSVGQLEHREETVSKTEPCLEKQVLKTYRGKKPAQGSLGQPPADQLRNKSSSQIRPGLEILQKVRSGELNADKPEKQPPQGPPAPLDAPPIDKLKNRSEILQNVRSEDLNANKPERKPPQASWRQLLLDKLKNKRKNVLQIPPDPETLQNVRSEELNANKPEKQPPQASLCQHPVDKLQNKGPCLEILENNRNKPDKELPEASSSHPSVCQLEYNSESFLQNVPCLELPPEIGKCRECGWTPSTTNVYCRFIEFRKLRYTKTGKILAAGFSSTETDALDINYKLWLPDTLKPPPDIDLETALFLLMRVGDHFCNLLKEEEEARKLHISDNEIVAWKRVVPGVREMCDACETTLFNYHWTCRKCGFVVCLDCYKNCASDLYRRSSALVLKREEKSWLRCTTRGLHRSEQLMPTQIIADDCLLKLGKMVHEMRDLWSIKKFCGCLDSKESIVNNTECRKAVENIMAKNLKEKQTSLDVHANVTFENNLKESYSGRYDSSSEEEEDPLILKKQLFQPMASTSSEKEKHEESIQNGNNALEFIRRYNWQTEGQRKVPIRIMTETVSTVLYPDIPHSWLCCGKVLRLTDPVCKDNLEIFQEQWKRGQPVIVSDVSKLLDQNLWNPAAFARDFGDEKNHLINCVSGSMVPNQPMHKFWDGFVDPSKRLKDFEGLPMLLKLKDWPPGEDFAEMLPTRFQDLMQALPLQDYTKRSGKLNLAARLPECFVRPDLGPKMYNAYGKPLPADKATTNLHLDVSDAVNVMVYVEVSQDGDSNKHFEETLAAIDEAGCDFLTRRRVCDKGELPGALWHIFQARDADKIRDLLNRVTVELGGRLEPHTDPIHDQSGYLDGPLRYRLYKEYGVQGYAILQCQGDAVFIPAGAPHQVRNLNNCIKVAEDFVSPENVVHCSHLTQEFRALSNNHSNHEDKLQIKNIIYHTVKDAVCALGSLVNKELGRPVIDVNNLDISTDDNSAPPI
ncbi:unnamed protein product [Ceutorhynchus assimilis]|uniref:[histone H3]-dimethyl-L-lysine(9) demethylase n=1 Tax=Ceutorhynchus assimilis TaxID=467358 RepID=A0A9P0DF00_9CUCU|nr:unnamed protein product [Ceutorhynchus assimilis]